MPLHRPSSLGREAKTAISHTEDTRGALIPLDEYPDFKDIRSPHWKDPFNFLRRFKAHLLVYIPDGEAQNSVIHTYGLGGLTPSTTGYPDLTKQEQGYGLFFSVNGFKNPKSRREPNLYALNAFFVDIDFPDKKNPPTKEALIEFKRAVYEDLSFCIANGREAFVADPRTTDAPPPPSAIVETKNGFHVYWFLDNPILLDDIRVAPDGGIADDLIGTPEFASLPIDEARVAKLLDAYRDIQRAIITRFQGDKACTDPTRVLRVPGSFHLKNPAEPFLVGLKYHDTNHVYSFLQMKEFWLENEKATESSYAYFEARKYIEEAKKPSTEGSHATRGETISHGLFLAAGLAYSRGGELPESIKAAIEREYPLQDRPSFRAITSPSGILPGTRNKSLLIAASLLRKCGYSEQEVLARYAGGYNGLPSYEITNTVKSAFRGAQPYDFGWNDPILSEYVTLEEISRVKEVVREAAAREREELRKQSLEKRKAYDKHASLSTETDTPSSGEDRRVPDSGGVDAGGGGGGDSELGSRRREHGDHAASGINDSHSRDSAHAASLAPSDGDDNREHPVVQQGSGDAQNREGEQGSLGMGEVRGMSLASLVAVEKLRPLIDDKTQKRIFNAFDELFIAAYPEIVSVDDVGFFKHHSTERYYEPLSEDGIRRMVNDYLAQLGCLNMRGVSQIASRVEALESNSKIRLSREESEMAFSHSTGITPVNTRSGLVDFNTGKIIPDSRKMFLTSVQPVTYEASIPTTDEVIAQMAPRWTSFMREVCGSNIPGETDNKIKLMQEMAGYCFTPYVHMQTAFIMLGAGSNGKSTFLDTILRIMGENDAASLSLEDICSQFRLSGLYRKRVNVIEEISNNYFESNVLKKLISGQQVVADRKFRAPITFRPTAKLVFAVNSYPRVNDQSYALYRRFKIIPFNVSFKEGNKDVFLLDKLWEERDGIFRWVMQGWQRLNQNKAFTESAEANFAGEDFKEQNSALVEFLLKNGEIYQEIKMSGRSCRESDYVVTLDALYAAYREYAKANGYGIKARGSFFKELETLNHYRLTGIHVDQTKCLVKGVRLSSTFNKADTPPSFY